MRVFIFGLACMAVLSSGLAAQAPQTTPKPEQPEPQPTLRTSSQIVIVDVVVQDHAGNPVHGLTREDFVLTEKKQPQAVRNFEEHSTLNKPKAGEPLPPMRPGEFTDYTPAPPSGALNVLLLDTLNTPMTDQAYVRNQLQQYVKKAQPGTRIAIFGLSHRLYMLQGFTSEPQTLRDAVEHKLVPRGSALLDDPVGTGADQPSMSQDAADMGLTMVASNLQQFEAQNAAAQTQLRLRYTIDAFNTLGHYLSAFPGRKNVIWFSGAFPIDILPDPSISNPFAVMETNDAEFRETTNLLSHAQVAVYPVDARGLMVNPAFSAANSGRNMRTPAAFSSAVMKFSQSQAEEHMTMDQLAADTGGQAFYNTNDLASAVNKAIDIGSNYYTLTFTPENHHWNGEYRDLRVALGPRLSAASYKLSYRHGYYAVDPLAVKRGAPAAPAAAAVPGDGYSYLQAAMSHGAPTPEEILFKVRVLPAAAGTEDKLAPANQPDAAHPIAPPFRRFLIDFASLTNGFRFVAQPDGHYQGKIDYTAYLFDNDGRLLNATGRTVTLNLTAEQLRAFRGSSANGHLEISAPAKGDTYLRIGLHDVVSDHMGVVELPLASVARLAPPAESAPAAQSAAPGTGAVPQK